MSQSPVRYRSLRLSREVRASEPDDEFSPELVLSGVEKECRQSSPGPSRGVAHGSVSKARKRRDSSKAKRSGGSREGQLKARICPTYDEDDSDSSATVGASVGSPRTRKLGKRRVVVSSEDECDEHNNLDTYGEEMILCSDSGGRGTPVGARIADSESDADVNALASSTFTRKHSCLYEEDEEMEDPHESDMEFLVPDDVVEFESSNPESLPDPDTLDTIQAPSITNVASFGNGNHEEPPSGEPNDENNEQDRDVGDKELSGACSPGGEHALSDANDPSDDEQPFADLIGSVSTRGHKNASSCAFDEDEEERSPSPPSDSPLSQPTPGEECTSTLPASPGSGIDSGGSGNAANSRSAECLSQQGPSTHEDAMSPLAELMAAQVSAEGEILEQYGDGDEDMLRKALEPEVNHSQASSLSKESHTSRFGRRRAKSVFRIAQKRTVMVSQDQCNKEWRARCNNLSSEFCFGREARLLEAQLPLGSRGRGQHIYKALPIETFCCADLAYVFSLDFKAKTRANPSSSSSYYQFRSSFGQLARSAVALRVIELKDVSKPGGVFKALLNVDFVQAFLRYFEEHGASTTVYLKSCHVSKAAKRASIYFGTIGNSCAAAGAKATAVAVTSTGLVSKRRARRLRAQRSYESIIGDQILSWDDLVSLAESALEQCTKCMKSVTDVVKMKGEEAAVTFLQGREKLLARISINLTVFIILSGCGQRPQVYAGLLTPSESDIAYWKTGRGLRLKTGSEKVHRAKTYIHFNESASRVFLTWVSVCRPAILAGHADPGTFLLHTRSLRVLRTINLRSTIKAFMSLQDPELHRITPMCVRASFATGMLQRYRDGLIYKKKTVGQFLDALGGVMNTSAEMLRQHYIALREDEYDSVCRELAI